MRPLRVSSPLCGLEGEGEGAVCLCMCVHVCVCVCVCLRALCEPP